MIYILLFISTFITVFALGFQSLNVNNGHYLAAFLTSFAICGGNLVILRSVPNGDTLAMLAYLAGGPLGVVSAMAVHRRTLGRREK